MRSLIIIRGVSGLVALLGLFVAGSLYIAPATFIPATDFTQSQVAFLAHMWAARQLAIAGVLGFGALMNHRGMLLAGLVLYCVMNMQDAIIGAVHHDSGLMIGALFFGVLAGVLAWRVTKMRM